MRTVTQAELDAMIAQQRADAPMRPAVKARLIRLTVAARTYLGEAEAKELCANLAAAEDVTALECARMVVHRAVHVWPQHAFSPSHVRPLAEALARAWLGSGHPRYTLDGDEADRFTLEQLLDCDPDAVGVDEAEEALIVALDVGQSVRVGPGGAGATFTIKRVS